MLGSLPPAPEPAEDLWLEPMKVGLAELVGSETPRTIYCIANSDDVPVAEVLARLDPGRDLVCQYNRCQHAAAFAATGVDALLCFHGTDLPWLIHGIGRDGRAVADVAGYGPGSRACLLRPARDGAFAAATETGLPDLGLPAFEVETSRLRALFYRPEAESIPSAGFASVLLFHLVNLRRALAGRPPHPIVLCGFSGRYAGEGFMGHDFHFEQGEYARLPNLSRLDIDRAAPAAATRLHHDLADVFHPGYDGHARTKAAMLFDVAKLHFAAGDVPAFVTFARKALAINPGFAETQWLMRALEILRARGTPATETADADRLLGDVETLRERWKSGQGRGGAGGAAYPTEVKHPQAEYGVGRSGRPRVLVVNETAKLGFNWWHLGCDLVSRNLSGRLTAHGLEPVGWVNGLAGLNRILAHDPDARFEAVVINGEGTLHHDADRAYELLTIGQALRRMGKRVFLVNSVWESNGRRLEELLAGFDLIAVRESASRDALASLRPDTRVVPDLCWLEDLPRTEPRYVCGVLDCVDRGGTAALERAAVAAGLPFFVMDRFFEAFHRSVSAGTPAASVPRVLLREDLGACAHWIGGRFHGVVLALAAGVPILSLPSNTHKIEAMLGDIGLAHKLLDPEALDAVRAPEDVPALLAGPRAFSADDWQRVAAYRAEARTEIDRLFADIAAAVG